MSRQLRMPCAICPEYGCIYMLDSIMPRWNCPRNPEKDFDKIHSYRRSFRHA